VLWEKMIPAFKGTQSQYLYAHLLTVFERMTAISTSGQARLGNEPISGMFQSDKNIHEGMAANHDKTVGQLFQHVRVES
jgi:hypothetical protein